MIVNGLTNRIRLNQQIYLFFESCVYGSEISF